MEKKTHLYVVGIIIVIVISIGIYFSNNSEPKPTNPQEVQTGTNSVFNFTTQSYYDTIILTGLQVLGIQNVVVTVEPLSDKAKKNFANQGGELQAHIREYDGYYYLYIDPVPFENAIDIIAHELIHLRQYNTGALIYKNDTLTWGNQSYHKHEIPYGERPWEVDADENGYQLANEIRQKIY